MKVASTREAGNAAPPRSQVTVDDSQPGKVIIGVCSAPPNKLIVVAIAIGAFAAMMFFVFAEGMSEPLAAALAGMIVVVGLLGEGLTVWHEEYRLDIAASRLTIVRRSRFRRAQSIVALNDANEVCVVCQTTDGSDYCRVLVVAAGRRVQLRLPARISLTDAKGGLRIGLVLAEALGVPLRDKSKADW